MPSEAIVAFLSNVGDSEAKSTERLRLLKELADSPTFRNATLVANLNAETLDLAGLSTVGFQSHSGAVDATSPLQAAYGVCETLDHVKRILVIDFTQEEGLVDASAIEKFVLQARESRFTTSVGYAPATEAQWRNRALPNVMFSLKNRLIYSGRTRVPGSHTQNFHEGYIQSPFVYASRDDLLESFAEKTRTPLSTVEDHDVLQLLETGIQVGAILVTASPDEPQRNLGEG